MSKRLEIVNPLELPNWDELLLQSGNQSFFHTSGWVRVLHHTYGYRPACFISSMGEHLDFLMPIMGVISPLTGRRGIFLPYTDHCPPHVAAGISLNDAIDQAIEYGLKVGWGSIEWRDGRYFDDENVPSEVYYAHDLEDPNRRFSLISKSRTGETPERPSGRVIT